MWINIGQIFCSFACPLVINIYSVCMHNKNPMTLVPRSESCHPASNVSMKPKTGISRPAVLAGECNGSADTLIATEMLANSKNFTCTEFLCRPAKSCLFGMCLWPIVMGESRRAWVCKFQKNYCNSSDRIENHKRTRNKQQNSETARNMQKYVFHPQTNWLPNGKYVGWAEERVNGQFGGYLKKKLISGLCLLWQWQAF